MNKNTLESFAMELFVAPLMRTTILEAAEAQGISKKDVEEMKSRLENDPETRFLLAKTFIEKMDVLKNQYDSKVGELEKEIKKFGMSKKDLARVKKLYKEFRNNQLTDGIFGLKLREILIKEK